MQHTPNSVVMFVSYGATPIICDIIDTIQNFDLVTFILVLCFKFVFEELSQWYCEDLRGESFERAA